MTDNNNTMFSLSTVPKKKGPCRTRKNLPLALRNSTTQLPEHQEAFATSDNDTSEKSHEEDRAAPKATKRGTGRPRKLGNQPQQQPSTKKQKRRGHPLKIKMVPSSDENSNHTDPLAVVELLHSVQHEDAMDLPRNNNNGAFENRKQCVCNWGEECARFSRYFDDEMQVKGHCLLAGCIEIEIEPRANTANALDAIDRHLCTAPDIRNACSGEYVIARHHWPPAVLQYIDKVEKRKIVHAVSTEMAAELGLANDPLDEYQERVEPDVYGRLRPVHAVLDDYTMDDTDTDEDENDKKRWVVAPCHEFLEVRRLVDAIVNDRLNQKREHDRQQEEVEGITIVHGQDETTTTMHPPLPDETMHPPLHEETATTMHPPMHDETTQHHPMHDEMTTHPPMPDEMTTHLANTHTNETKHMEDTDMAETEEAHPAIIMDRDQRVAEQEEEDRMRVQQEEEEDRMRVQQEQVEEHMRVQQEQEEERMRLQQEQEEERMRLQQEQEEHMRVQQEQQRQLAEIEEQKHRIAELEQQVRGMAEQEEEHMRVQQEQQKRMAKIEKQNHRIAELEQQVRAMAEQEEEHMHVQQEQQRQMAKIKKQNHRIAELEQQVGAKDVRIRQEQQRRMAEQQEQQSRMAELEHDVRVKDVCIRELEDSKETLEDSFKTLEDSYKALEESNKTLDAALKREKIVTRAHEIHIGHLMEEYVIKADPR